MEDALGPIDIEFLINNPELLEQSKQAQTTLTNAINKMETDLATLKKAADDALKIDPLAVNNYVSQINRLEAALVEKRRVLETLVTSQIDTRPIADGLREVEQVGVRTFEQVGESAVKSTNYFKAAWSSLRQIAYALPGIGVAGIIGFATEPIIAYLSKLDLFKAKLTELKLKQDEMNNAFASSDYTNAIKNINKLTIDIDLAKQGFLDKTKVLNEYNTVLGETIGRADSLDKAESLIVQKGNAYIQMTLLKAAANLAAADSAKKAYEAAQIQAKPVDDFASIFELPVQNRTAADVEASEKNLAAARKARQDAQVKEAQDQSDKFLKIQKDFETKAAEIAKKYHLDFFGGKQDGSNEQQNALNALLQTEIGLRERIVEFTSRQNEKSLSPDQQALTQISDQFAAITFQINQANDKYDAFVKKYGQAAVDTFNASPDNKVKLAKTDPATLAVAENAAIDNQADLNENNYIQQDIEKKKKLYADYYAYRAKVGEDAANKEYADLLLSGKDFATYLSNIEKSIPADDQSGAMQKRREITTKARQQDVEDQKKRLEQLLEGVKTYETERENLTAVYQTKRKDLIEKGKTDEAKVLDQQYKEQIGRLDDANFEKLQSVKELYSGINQMSKASAQQLINDVQAELNARLAANEITDAEAKKVQQTINKAQESLNLRTPESLMQAGQYISELGQSLSNTNGTMAQFVSEAGSAISAVGNLDKMTVKLNADLQYNKEHLDDQKSTFGDYVNLVASGLTAVVNIIGSVTSASAARKKAEEDYYNSVIEFQNQYNIALDEELRLKSQKDGNIFLTSYSAEIKDAVNSYKAASEQYEKSLQDLQAGQAKVGQKNKVSGSAIASDAAQGAVAGAAIGSVVPVIGTTIGAIGGAVIGGLVGLFGGKKKADVFAPLLQVYPQLIDANGKFNESLAKTLINTNQVSDKTKILLQNTISYYDEEQQSIDQINSALSNLAQNLGVNLQSALVQAFETGGDAAKAFEGTVSSVIGNIVQQFLFEDIFSSEFDKLNAKLKDTVLAGGSEGDITADFVDFFKQAAPLAQKFTDGLKAAKDAAAQDGIDLFTNPNASSSTPNTMAGAIKGITESQANILEGVERGMQLSLVNIGETLEINLQTQQEQLSEMKQQTLLQMQIAANTKRSADNTDVLPKMIPEMNESLKNINKNTADTSGNILRAAGLV